MSIGRPIVTTNVPGCREVVKHGENGLLVEKGNEDQLSAAIEVLLNDEPLREKMGRNARSIAEREFSIDKVLEQTFEIYERE